MSNRAPFAELRRGSPDLASGFADIPELRLDSTRFLVAASEKHECCFPVTGGS